MSVIRSNSRYAKLERKKKELPLTESLALTIDRVIPYWNETILPRMKSGQRVIIAAHGNSLRALVKIWMTSERRRDSSTEYPDRRAAGL